VFILENVEEFVTWGPLTKDGRPCPRNKGREFRAFVNALKRHGYAVEWRELRACDYGAPTSRKRLFLVARCDGLPIVWPEPTHGPGHAHPWRTAAECIDWSLPCPSIFGRERPLAEATLRRIARGIRKYVLEAAEPFIVRIGQTGRGDGGKVHAAGQPLSTVTSKAEHLLAVPTLVQAGYGERAGQAPRVPGLEKPIGTVVGANKHALVAAFLAKHYGGNETPGCAADIPISTITSQDHHHLVTAHITKFREGSTGSAISAPLHTVTAGGQQARPGTGNAMGLVASTLVKLRGTSTAAPVDAPAPTVSAQGTHLADVQAFLIKFYGTGGQLAGCDEPMHTLPTKDRMGLVTVAGQDYVIADIGMRMLQPRELARAQGFGDDTQLELMHNGRPLPKHAQVRMVGNSVCPVMAEVLVRANYDERDALQEAA
jgi:DNA (cytosine-5)-methyltransferase 1